AFAKVQGYFKGRYILNSCLLTVANQDYEIMDTNTYNINLPKVVIGEMGVVFQIDARRGRLIQHGSFPPIIIELDKLPRFRDEPVLIYDWKKHNHLEIPLREALKSEYYELILLPKEMTGLTQTPPDNVCERINRESWEN